MDNKFDYSQSELEMNRVMKMQQEHLQDVTSQVNKDAAQLDELQAKLERILKKRNVTIDEEQLRQKLATDEIDTPEELALVRIEDTVDWDTLVAKSTQRYSKNGPVTLDNLLTQNEIRYGMAEIESIDATFSKNTGLTIKDMGFLATAITLQSARWFILQKMFTLAAKGATAATKAVTGGGAAATKAITSSSGGAKAGVKAAISTVSKVTEVVGASQTFGQLIKRTKDAITSKDGNAAPAQPVVNPSQHNPFRSWRDIIIQCAPYDLPASGDLTKAYGIGLEDSVRSILGADKIWGCIVGTMNYLTDTVTFDNYNTYRVVRDPELRIVEKISLKQMFMDAVKSVNDDVMRLPVAVYAQIMHQQGRSLSEVEFLSTFSEQRISKLYTDQYHLFTKSKRYLLVGDQAMIASLINMTIGLYHTLQYDSAKDGTYEQYEARTRTILSMSNAMSSASNAVFTLATQNWFALDAGGMIIAFNRFLNDSKFTTRLKQEMLKQKMDSTFKIDEDPGTALAMR